MVSNFAAYPLSIDKHSVNNAASWPLARTDHHHLRFFQQGAHKPGERSQIGYHLALMQSIKDKMLSG